MDGEKWEKRKENLKKKMELWKSEHFFAKLSRAFRCIYKA